MVCQFKTFIRTGFLLIFQSVALAMLLTLPLQAASELPEEERAVIALFGDSVTGGENLNHSGPRVVGGSTTSQGCPSVYLTGLLLNEPSRASNEKCPTESLNSQVYDSNSERRNAIVANWAFGGSGSSRGVSRIEADLSQNTAQLVGNQYIVLIIYGTNDRSRGISAPTTGTNISAMITKARGLGYDPVIGLVTPRDDRTGNGPTSISALNNQIRASAQAQGAQVVDHYSNFVNYPGSFIALLDQESFFGTLIRLHPNDQGYLLIAETWFQQALRNRIPVVPNSIVIAPIISLLLDD